MSISSYTLISLLKPDGPQEIYFVRATDPESQHFANEIEGALASAGWKPVMQPYNWGTWLTFPNGVEIMVQDIKDPPRFAVSLQIALMKIGIKALPVSFNMVGKGRVALYIGPNPRLKE